MLEVTLAPGVQVYLLPQRALYWGDEATLFVADLHAGKADAFHAAGIPIPAAVTLDDLARLSAILEATRAQRLVILGDFFHAAASQSIGVLSALSAWRAAHAALDVWLIAGNHDLRAGPPPAALGIVACGAEVRVGPFHCVHAPQDEPAPYTLCGHLHPIAILAERAGGRYGARSARLPCFHVGPRQTIMPAFSTFTGGKSVACRPSDRVFVTTGEELFEAALGR